MKDFKTITELCRTLRKTQTEAEKLVWNELRNRKINGLKFLRQHPIIYETFNHNIYFFIADFYCHEKLLVIEIDGSIHDLKKEYDENRELVLKEKEINVIRFKNDEVINKIGDVLQKLKRQLEIINLK